MKSDVPVCEATDPARAGSAPLVFTYSRPEQPVVRRSLIRLVEWLSGRAAMERMYRAWVANRPAGETIFAAGLRVLEVRAEVSPVDLGRVPRRGGLLVVANHPFGIIDGLLVGEVIDRLRGDVKILTHSLLCQPPEARDVLLPVDFGAGEAARRTSAETRARAQAWLLAGHAVVVFPGGSVATSVRPWGGPAVDVEWHPFVARLAALPGVVTVPMFLHGQNSRLFQIVSHFSYPLRVALIFRETRAWAGYAVKLSIGAPVPVGRDRAAAVQAMRAASYGLAGRDARAVFVWPRWIRW
ncbi:MAG: lysophospholipid acyltransferase family protein [Paracoccaceae bacterium]